MDNIQCSCTDCGRRHNKEDMHSRPTEYYPYKGSDILCTACKDKRAAKNALKATQAKLRSSLRSRSSYRFNY
ncbi:hypothetical protein LEJE111609_01770 [Lelliottia jeotgali]